LTARLAFVEFFANFELSSKKNKKRRKQNTLFFTILMRILGNKE